jgi:hypothetical protein
MACGSSTEVLNRAGPSPNGRFVRVHAATLA